MMMKPAMVHIRSMGPNQIRAVVFWLVLVFFSIVMISKLGVQSLAGSVQRGRFSKPAGVGLTVLQRMAKSEKAWRSKLQERLRIMKMTPTFDDFPFFSGERLPNYPGGGPYYTIWDFFPPAYTCPWVIERVGRFGDGGKWVCGMEKYAEREDTKSIVYSFGVERDSAFEEEMLKRTNAEVFAYDFSVDGFGDQLTPEHRNRSHFFKLGIGAVDEPYTKPPYYTIKTLMTRNNHSYIDILKIDVEGAEFDSLEKLFYDFEGLDLPVGQLMVELHLVNDLVINFKRLTEWWARLESFGMRGTYLEVNLLAVVLNNDLPGQGRQPRCVEYVWVNANDPKNVLWVD